MVFGNFWIDLNLNTSKIELNLAMIKLRAVRVFSQNVNNSDIITE